MKRVHVFAAAAMACAALIGCAGGGDDTGTASGGGGGIAGSTPRIEAVVVVDRSNLKDPSKYTDAELRDPTVVDPNDLVDPSLLGVQDPMNLQTSESFYFELVTYDNAGHRTIIDDNVTWDTSDETGRFGNIGSNSGLFLVGNNVNQTDQFIFANYKGQRYQVQFAVHPRQVRLLGSIKNQDTGAGVAGVTVFFFDNFGSLVAQVKTAYDGKFRASVPTNTAKFTPTVDSIPTAYYQSFLFGGLRYTVGFPQCRGQLSSLEQGTVQMDNSILLKPRTAGVPTPPPTGCTP